MDLVEVFLHTTRRSEESRRSDSQAIALVVEGMLRLEDGCEWAVQFQHAHEDVPWSMSHLVSMLVNRHHKEQTVGYTECHDQVGALAGQLPTYQIDEQ